MPELPEVQTVVSELNRKLKNKTIDVVVVNAPKMVAVGPGTVSNFRKATKRSADKFVSLLKGQKIVSVKRRAKLLIFNFLAGPGVSQKKSGNNLSGPLVMLVHLKMTGQFIFENKKQRAKTGGKYRLLNKPGAPLIPLPSKHTHVVFSFTDGSTLYFNDVRKFGYLKIVNSGEIGLVKELQEYGPEPLDKKFTPEVFLLAVKKRFRSPIKLVLMDPKVVVGIGNIYSDEILFHAGIRPGRAVSRIPANELLKIYKYIKIVLNQAIKTKGSSVGDFIRTDGAWGQMSKFHFVYGRKGQKCKKCGTIIESVKLGGRTGSFCPNCQK